MLFWCVLPVTNKYKFTATDTNWLMYGVWTKPVWYHVLLHIYFIVPQRVNDFHTLVPEVVKYWAGVCFTNNFSIIILIYWKIHSPLIPCLAIRSLQHIAHATTAELSWHVQTFVAITALKVNIRAKANFYWIWFVREKSLVQCAHDSCVF